MKTCYVVHEVGLQMKQSVKGEKIISCNGLYESRKKHAMDGMKVSLR
jgi:hypothetical protein